MFIYKFNTLTFILVSMLILFIFNNVFMLNFLKVYIKCDKSEALLLIKLNYEINRFRAISFRLELALIATETSAVIGLSLYHSFFPLLLFLYLRIFD